MSDDSNFPGLRMVVLAGPNGSGKSTVTNGLKLSPVFPPLYINADDISKNELAHISDANSRNMAAAKLAEDRRKKALQNREAFAFETVMSTPGKIALFDEARSLGFSVDLIFVTTSDPVINFVRVENRVLSGGHTVPEEKIFERYARAMQLLPSAIEKADSAEIYDNSKNAILPQLVAAKSGSQIKYFEPTPDWVNESLINVCNERRSSREKLIGELKVLEPDAEVLDANIGNNKCYSGLIVGITDFHVMQRNNTNLKQYLLHDKALCAPRTYEVKKSSVVSYAFGADGKHKFISLKKSHGKSL
ncbi:TPA: zeta toxin family protein [Yersinia enterocolitica]|uniref:zeta toxin family protein n=1 Tax=Yersinia enterocolitica TaxID=630 RepID=UPI0029A9860F|nr:zeta toxin family protein [Yersinia enterocolitica]EKN5104252.1 hypothetical protein [Yersinia enterocolitica]EKN6091022.1 hypothetical protein [Yersinia enterocolitica]ELX2238780.1 zeta toxin family protein [Yersinia enterocolitica]ELY5241985.1 zeta toxin family protein [Yersinia enterocolitica]